jgi:hypothetical protein
MRPSACPLPALITRNSYLNSIGLSCLSEPTRDLYPSLRNAETPDDLDHFIAPSLSPVLDLPHLTQLTTCRLSAIGVLAWGPPCSLGLSNIIHISQA